MAVINMSKNQKISMVKEDGSAMKNIFIGVNWDESRYTGEKPFDLDLNGFLTNNDRRVKYPQDIVNYNTYSETDYPWIWYSGDNRTGDDDESGYTYNGEHYDEAFIVHADKFPENRTDFTIGLSIYHAVERTQNFGMINNCVLTVCDYDDPSKVYKFNMSEDENFERLNAVEIGRLYKYNGGFKFQAIGQGYLGGMTELFKNFGLDIDEGTDD